MIQLHLFGAISSADEMKVRPQIASFLKCAPALPPVIRYYDEFDDVTRSIDAPQSARVFRVHAYGTSVDYTFDHLPTDCAALVKQAFLFVLGLGRHVATARKTFDGAKLLSPLDVERIIAAGPLEISQEWVTLRARELPLSAYIYVKTILRMLCTLRFNGWSPDHEGLLYTRLPNPTVVADAAVRSGQVFLTIEQESHLVRHLDRIAAQLDSLSQPDDLAVEDAGLLLCSYQFAMRPIQIASVKMSNCRIWSDLPDAAPSVHITFHMAKQRSVTARHPLTRRVKREWGVIIRALHEKRTRRKGATAADRLFDVDSAREVGLRLSKLTAELLGVDSVGTATDLRHSAAQRLVDAGANHEELAEFMGHSRTDTGLIYYDVSPTHAERVNRALGVSDVYQRVARIAHDRFISADELAQLKEEQQIAAVPHGIPIAGIGGCSSGQPTCRFNPVMACYGCQKFLPLHDRTTHEIVLASMREIVVFFEKSSKGDVNSPAYLQLRRTISDVQVVIDELSEDDK